MDTLCKPRGLHRCLYRSDVTLRFLESQAQRQGCRPKAGSLGLEEQPQGFQPFSGHAGDCSFEESSGPWRQPGVRDLCLVMSQPSYLLSAEWQERLAAVTQRTQQSVAAKGGGGDAHLGGAKR